MIEVDTGGLLERECGRGRVRHAEIRRAVGACTPNRFSAASTVRRMA